MASRADEPPPSPETPPIVTVVVPAFNAADFISDALESVLAQTFRSFEVVVVDDGSTDDTPSIVEAFGEPVRCVRQERSGPSRARNRGIAEARGRYVAFLDADDLWLPRKLERQVAALGSRPELGLITCGVEALTDTGSVVDLEKKRQRLFSDGNVARSILAGSGVATPTVMVPRQVLEDVGGFNEDLRIGEDDNLWIRIAAKYPAEMVDEVLVRTRVRGDSLTSDVELLFEGVCGSIEHLRVEHPATYAEIRDAVPDKLAGVHFVVGYGRFTNGDLRGARRGFLGSLRHRPFRILPWLMVAVTLLPLPLVRWLQDREWLRRLKRKVTRRDAARGGPGPWPPEES